MAAKITIEIPDEMKRELDEALPEYFPADEWARNQLVPAIAQFVEANREAGQPSGPASGGDSTSDGFDETLEARIDQILDGETANRLFRDISEAGD